MFPGTMRKPIVVGLEDVFLQKLSGNMLLEEGK